MRRALWFVLAILAALPSALHAQAEKYDRAVVIDLSSRPAAETRARVFAVSDTTFIKELNAIAGDTILPTRREAVVTDADSLKVGNRWLSRPGDRVAVFVFHDTGTVAQVRFQEESRRTRLAGDLTTLAQLALQIATSQPEALDEDKPTVLVTRQVYTLRRARANLAVTGSVARPPRPAAAPRTQAGASGAQAAAPGPQAAAPPAAAAASKPADDNTASITLVTGPSEHLFLSANAGATDASTLKYDDDSNSLQPRETPTGFFIGVNYSFGDILTDPSEAGGSWYSNFFHGMYVGGALQGSRRPFDQAGVHLGFRNNPLPLLKEVLDFETVSPYVGLVWAKNDQVDAAGNRLGERRYGRRELVWGVSLNLDKALGWVGGGEK